ncbi:MAG: hypothetical protein JXA49_01725 [Actinobacteria bacterium]|nr:hypothetical protein [Actinomycetota bacterium]
MNPVIDQLLLESEKIDGFTSVPGGQCAGISYGHTAILEIAGRDSIAAGILTAESGEYDSLIPTIVYTGSEYGNWNTVLRNCRKLASFMRDACGLLVPPDPVIIGSPKWFHAVSCRFSTELYEMYGIPGTCIACHMYLHAVRIPLAKEIGATAIVSGERLKHDDKLKINQLLPALEAYKAVLESKGVDLEFPLKQTGCSVRIQEKVAPLFGDMEDSHSQMRCVLESNYRDRCGQMIYSEGGLQSYLDGFLVPATRKILDSVISEKRPIDYISAVMEVLREEPD